MEMEQLSCNTRRWVKAGNPPSIMLNGLRRWIFEHVKNHTIRNKHSLQRKESLSLSSLKIPRELWGGSLYRISIVSLDAKSWILIFKELRGLRVFRQISEIFQFLFMLFFYYYRISEMEKNLKWNGKKYSFHLRKFWSFLV